MAKKHEPRPRYPARKAFRALCRWCMGYMVTSVVTNGRGKFTCPRCGAVFEKDGGDFRLLEPGSGKRRWGESKS